MVAQVAGYRADTCGNMQPFLILREPETEQNETTGTTSATVVHLSSFGYPHIYASIKTKVYIPPPPDMIRAFDVPDIPKGRAFVVGNLMWWGI